MNSDWSTAIEFVFKEEGGANGELIAGDKGGYTKFGIASAANPDVDVPNLTREGAEDLYRKRYWQACKCDELPSRLAIAVMDAAVNQGVKGAGKMLQIALNGPSGSSLVVDGVIGDSTVTAAHKAGASITRRFLAQRMARYARTIMKDPTQEMWIENWSSRLMRCAELVLKSNEVKA